jgi:endonuclease YncB( thermonuclease family)
MTKQIDLRNSKNIFQDIKNFLSGNDEEEQEEFIYFNVTEDLQSQFLEKVTYDDVPFFCLQGYKTMAKCVKIYDGDTGTFVFFLNGKPFKFRIRLSNIDTAELKSDDPEEVKLALEAKETLEGLIGNELVYIECGKFDKYGRVLGKIYRDNKKELCFNDYLLEKNLAYEYDGGKRKHFREWYKNEKTKERNIIDDNINDSEVLNNEFENKKNKKNWINKLFKKNH